MRYRTVIEIIADAEDKNEAIDIAGEYLKGNLETGVQMKCTTKPLNSRTMLKSIIFLCIVSFIIAVISFGFFKNSHFSISNIESFNAIQPPLKTSQTIDFKKDWEKEEAKKVIDHIKK